jgi:hypothetical protein
MGVAMPLHPHQLGQKPPCLPWKLLAQSHTRGTVQECRMYIRPSPAHAEHSIQKGMVHQIAQGNSSSPKHHYAPSSGHCPPRRTRMGGVPIPNKGKCTPELDNQMGVAMPLHPHQLGQKPPCLPWKLLAQSHTRGTVQECRMYIRPSPAHAEHSIQKGMVHQIAQGNSSSPKHHYAPSSGHCPPRRTRMGGVPIPNKGKCTPE